jgi:predicted nucleic acid-binding protein
METRRQSVVIDGSCFLAWILPDEHSPVAESVLNALSTERLTGVIQPLFYLEVTNTLVLVARKNRISLSEFDTYLEALLDLPFELSDYSTRLIGLVETVRLAQEYRLTVYDASYLALALHKDISLVTEDQALASAADDLGILFK